MMRMSSMQLLVIWSVLCVGAKILQRNSKHVYKCHSFFAILRVKIFISLSVIYRSNTKSIALPISEYDCTISSEYTYWIEGNVNTSF